MKQFSATIRVDGRNFETKPFNAKNKEEAWEFADKKAQKDFPKADGVDCVNIEEI